MAAEFIDALSPEAEKRIKAYNTLVLELIGNIGKANSMQVGARTPSGTDNNIRKIAEDAVKAEGAIKGMQQVIVSAAQERHKLSVQERTDNSILLAQEKQQAVIVSEVAGAYKKLSAEQARAATNVQNIIARGRQATQTQRQYNKEIADATREFNQLNARVLKADAAVGRFQRNVGNYPKTLASVNQLLGALGVTLGAAGVAMLAQEFFQTTKELQSLDLALKSVTGSEADFAAQQQFLSNIANKYGLEIKNLTGLYTQFYVAAKDKLAGQEIQDIFENIGKSGAALGLSNEALQRSFTAVNQMLSKGVVSAEELRGQLSESLPGAVQALLKAVQKLHPELKVLNERDLFDLIKQGKILSADVLPEMARQLVNVTGADKAEGIETLTKATNRFSNAWTDLVRAFSEGDSIITASIAKTIDLLAQAAKGASIIIAGEEKRRNDELAAIRQGGYDQQMEDYKARQDLDDAYILRKNAFFKSEIERLQAEVQANVDANNAILEASKKRYVPNAAEDLETNRKATVLLNNEIKSYYGRLAAGNKILEENNKQTKKNTELTKEQLKAIEDLKRERYDTRIAELQLEQQVIDRTLNDEEQFYSVRIAALDKHMQKRIEILTVQFNEETRRAGKSYDKQKQALIKFHSESLKEIENYNAKRAQLESLELQPIDIEAVDVRGEMTNMLDKDTEARDKNNAAIDEGNRKTKEALAIMKDYVGQFSESFFDNAGLSTTFDILSDKILGFGVDAKVTTLAVIEAFQEMFNFINEASQKRFDAEYERLEKEKNIAIQFAGESDSAKQEIERQYTARRQLLQRRELKAQQQIAKFNIITDTAQAVISALNTKPFYLGLALSVVAASIGAAQLSAVSSQQVPQYWKGTENAPGGWAWTQEKGAEAIFSKDGKLKSAGSDKGAQLTLLEKGDKVKTADWTKKNLMFDNGLNNILNERGIMMQQPSVNFNGLTKDEYFAGVNRVETAVRNFRPTNISMDRRGWNIHHGDRNAHIQNMNNRFDGTGQINP